MKIFNQNQPAKVKRSAFDLSHERKLTLEMGYLTPVLVQEVVPGDKFKIDTQSFIRFAPMVAPVMHRIDAYIHYFYVPTRLLWKDWEKFITGQEPLTVPTQVMENITVNSLADHMGLPVGDWQTATVPEEVSLLPFRAYWKIWSDYYRDQNFHVELNPLDDDYVDMDINTATPFPRAWNKDYFTSALPWAQKGNPVTMDAIVQYKEPAEVILSTGGMLGAGEFMKSGVQVGSTNNRIVTGSGSEPTGVTIENIDGVSIEVEELRRATRLQRWMERNARSGSRYVEHLLSHWGIKSSDARLQRAEYIGGGKSPVVISEVLNTTGTADLPQGYMAGHGINVGRTNQANKFCEEHGYIIGIMSVTPQPTYQQGLPKFFSRKLNLDYYFPEFAQLGEQEILNKELFYSIDAQDNETTFGYQSRYAEYKFNQSTVHGDFKEELDFWHLGRKFASLPTLGTEFIECIPDDRIFAVSEDPAVNHLYVQLYHKIIAVRPLPFFNDPKL